MSDQEQREEIKRILYFLDNKPNWSKAEHEQGDNYLRWRMDQKEWQHLVRAARVMGDNLDQRLEMAIDRDLAELETEWDELFGDS